MLGRRAFSRAVPAAVLIALVSALGSCSGGSGTGLESALSHVADTASTRNQVWYDNTAELVALAGGNPASQKGFAPLRGNGAYPLVDTFSQLPSDTGINVFNENYAISAGLPPHALSLVHGGQNASTVTSRMTKLGWKKEGGKLVAPSPQGANPDAALYALNMGQVQPSGSDVVFGGSGADLSQIGSPSGSTLASDPRISALAGCLGNVVAAGLFSGGHLGGKNPAAVAIGVGQPASNTGTPHAVVCAAWSTQAQATQYAADVRSALSSGVSPVTDQRYSSYLRNASVTSVGGSQHVVEWQADTPGNSSRVIQMVSDFDLPALPDCSRLPAAAARVTGCH